MTRPFFYSKSSCCLSLPPPSHHRRTLLAANDTLFVLIEEDDSNPDADATLRVLPSQLEEKSAGSRAPASGLEIAIPREHLPLGSAGSTSAPCVLNNSANSPAFFIFNLAKKRLLKVDTRLAEESTELQVMQYTPDRTPSPLPSNYGEVAALGVDADGVAPLFTYLFYMPNGVYCVRFIRVVLNGGSCELETQKSISSGQQHFEQQHLSIVSDGKQKVAILSKNMIDVYDCQLYTHIYSIAVPQLHRPSHPISVAFTTLYGQEWILCCEKTMLTGTSFDSGKQRAVRLDAAPREQTWREIVFPPTFTRDDAVKLVPRGRELYYASCDGIRVMNEGPAPLERIARDLCVTRTRKPIRRIHPYLVNYPVRFFYVIVNPEIWHTIR